MGWEREWRWEAASLPVLVVTLQNTFCRCPRVPGEVRVCPEAPGTPAGEVVGCPWLISGSCGTERKEGKPVVRRVGGAGDVWLAFIGLGVSLRLPLAAFGTTAPLYQFQF